MNSLPSLFKAIKETHEQHKTKIEIDELITRPTNITLLDKINTQKTVAKVKNFAQKKNRLLHIICELCAS
jgi:hypothetical protein